MNAKKWIVLLGIFGLIFLGSICFSKKKTKSFSEKNIRSSLSVSSKWYTDPLTNDELSEIHRIFAQEFHYLASGAQCYCFCSEDGKYVLKFFKMKHLLPKYWLKYFIFPGLKNYRFRKYDKRILKRQNIFRNYKSAYEKCKDETGLVYIHLTKTKEIDAKLKLIDQYQKEHYLQVNQFEFILQKKACLLGDHLNQLMAMGCKKEALESLRTLILHIAAQCEKGYIDQDSGIFHNYGFIGNQVIHFDIGRMEFNEDNKIFAQKEILRVRKKIEKWLEIYQPSLLLDFENIMSRFTLKDSFSFLSRCPEIS